MTPNTLENFELGTNKLYKITKNASVSLEGSTLFFKNFKANLRI